MAALQYVHKATTNGKRNTNHHEYYFTASMFELIPRFRRRIKSANATTFQPALPSEKLLGTRGVSAAKVKNYKISANYFQQFPSNHSE